MNGCEVELLERARALVLRRWCQGAFALDGRGLRCAPESPHAVAFDALGAIMRAARELGADPGAVSHAISHMQHATDPSPWCGGVTAFNDKRETKLEHVVRAFDVAIEIARARYARRLSA